MNILEVVNEIKESKRNVKIRDFYDKVLYIKGSSGNNETIIDIDCTKVLKKNVPKNFILNSDDAIKLIGYKLMRAGKRFIINSNFSEEIFDKILTREDPLNEVFSTYKNAIKARDAKIERTNKRIEELQKYVSIMEQIGGE